MFKRNEGTYLFVNPIARALQQHLSPLVAGNGFVYIEEVDGFTITITFQQGIFNLEQLIIKYFQSNDIKFYLYGKGNYIVPNNRVINITLNPETQEFEGLPLLILEQLQSNVVLQERKKFLFELPVTIHYTSFRIEEFNGVSYPVHEISMTINNPVLPVFIDVINAVIDLLHEYVNALKQFIEPKQVQYCWRCGSKVEADSLYCTTCGVKL